MIRRSALGVVLVLAPVALQAQEIRVSLHVTEETGGLFQSAFASELRSLGVRIVGEDEPVDYLLRVIVLCSPEPCESANLYAVSVQVARPPRVIDVQLFLARMDLRATVLGIENFNLPGNDNLADLIRLTLDSKDSGIDEFYRVEMGWAAAWGRQVYRDAVTELVAEIDVTVFDDLRERTNEGDR